MAINNPKPTTPVALNNKKLNEFQWDAEATRVYEVDSDGKGIHETITSATNTKVNVGASSTTVLVANSDRREAIIVNDSDEAIYISLSSTAIMNEGIRLNPNGGSLIETEYVGEITAICSSGSKNLTIVEK